LIDRSIDQSIKQLRLIKSFVKDSDDLWRDCMPSESHATICLHFSVRRKKKLRWIDCLNEGITRLGPALRGTLNMTDDLEKRGKRNAPSSTHRNPASVTVDYDYD